MFRYLSAIMRKRHHIWVIILKVLLAVFFLPIALFLVVASILYIPAVQDFVVSKATEKISGSTGLDVHIDRARLAFPLDLAVDGFVARDGGDTLVDARTLRLDLEFLPLLSGQANVNGIDLQRAKLDTKDYVGGAHIKGTIGHLRAATNGVHWEGQRVTVDYATLHEADLAVCLSDTALEDTTTTPSHWVVEVMQARLTDVKANVALAGDLPDAAQDTLRGTQMWVSADIREAQLRNGLFDTGKNNYTLQGFTLKHGDIAYKAKGRDGLFTRRTQMTPIPADKQQTAKDTLRSWYDYTDNMQELAAWKPFARKNAEGHVLSGKPFDADNIVLSDVNVRIDGLSYNERGVLRTNVRHASFTEQSGISISDLSGQVYLDDERVRIPNLTVKTAHSTITLSLDLPFSALETGRIPFNTKVDLAIGWQDVLAYGKDYLPSDILKLYPHETLYLNGSIAGTLSNLSLQPVNVNLPGYLKARLNGRLQNLTAGVMGGNLSYDLKTGERLPALYKKLLPDVASTVTLPGSVAAAGHVKFHGDDYAVNTTLATGGGTAKVDARVNLARETYTADMQAHAFPLQTLLPSQGLSAFTGTLKASGNSFDPMGRGSRLDLDADIRQFAYSGYDLSGIKLDGNLLNSTADFHFDAHNPMVTGNGNLTATIGNRIDGKLSGNFREIDLRKLGVTTDTLNAGAALTTNFSVAQDLSAIHVDGSVAEVFVTTPRAGFDTEDLDFAFTTEGDTTWLTAQSGDLDLRFGTHGDLNKLTPRFSKLAEEVERQLNNKELDQERLKRELPPMTLHLQAGQGNPLSRYLRFMGYSFNTAHIDLSAHPATGITGDAEIGALTSGALLIDTVSVDILQDSTGLQLNGLVKNYTKKNPTKFETTFHAYLLSKGAGLEAQFYDNLGEKGIDLGLRADLVDDGINIVLYPEHPVLAYRSFTINKDNYIFLGRHQQIRADIDLVADDGTGLKIYSEATDSVNDITLSVNNVNLKELSHVMPYLPQMEGMLNGDFHVYDNHKTISAMGTFDAAGFAYDGTKLGNVGGDVVYLPKGNGEHYANAFIRSEGQDVLEAEGTYHETGDTFDGQAHLHDFPLPMLNSFLSGTDIALKGKAGGDIGITGQLSNPVLNGSLDMDSAHVYSDVYGFDLRMDDKPLVFKNSRILFENYNMYSTGENPLTINGNVDLSNLDKVSINLDMKATDFQIINAEKKRQSMLFGTVYADFMGSMKGTVSNLSIRGKLDVKKRTDMTYILKDSPLTVDNRLDDIVQFVNFNDTTATDDEVVESTSNFDLALGINISDEAHFHCYLSEDGQSYVNIDGGGNLILRITQQGDMRLTGKLTAESGEMKYELPVIPLRTFNIVEGSTIDFTGDPANPTLNVQAKESMKCLVTENDQQRTVAFDVGVSITKSLSDMGLEFTIEAPEDLSIQNQLASMSKEQRNKAAVAMMATGMYITDSGAQTSGFKANNALNAFLQNEIQSIAGNALKTVDLSVGVETGTSLTGTTTTDYSFQFSKRLWDDRIRVIIGGRVSAGKNADNRAESIINNVSVEYRMNQGATRYIRVFYDRDQQDPLEGQLTNTGIGYSVRKKATKFGELFLRSRKKETQAAPAQQQAPQADADKNEEAATPQ